MSLESIIKNWQLICCLVSIVFIAGISFATNDTINAAQDRIIATHTVKLAEDDKREQLDAISDALLKQDVATIKKDVAETKRDVKELLKEIRKLEKD